MVEVVSVFELVEVVEPLLPGARLRGSLVASSESRTTGRGVAGRRVGLTRSEGGARSEGAGAPPAVGPGNLSSVWDVFVSSLAIGAVLADACPFVVA